MRHSWLWLQILLVLTVAPLAAADEAQKSDSPSQEAVEKSRYLVIRTFPKGALEGLDAATKAEVNQRNTTLGVRWVRSYANADLTKTYCIYEGPSEEAVREAADANGLPVDAVVEVPVDLFPD